MAADVLQAFKGILPGIDDTLTDYAKRAHNVKTCHGRLDPWKTPKKITCLCATSAHLREGKAYYSKDCDRYFTDVEPCGNTVISGPGMCPAWIDDCCRETVLGFPCPDQATVKGYDYPDEEGAFTELRSYVITYGDGCDEGAPSMPSISVKANKDDRITIGLPAPDPKYNGVTEICIYRMASTWDVSEGMWEPQGGSLTQGLHSVTTEACYFLVDKVPIGTHTFVDDGSQESTILCDTLVTECYTPPPEDLCITGMTHLGSLVGFKDDCVYFSERNTHYAWPDKYKINIGCEIVNVCVDGNTVFVGTKGKPAVILDYPEAIDAMCREPQFSSKPAPLESAKSMVCLNGTAIYATAWGIVALSPDTTVTTLSGEWCRDNWESIHPCTIRAACYGSDYFFTSINFSGIYGNLLGAEENVISTIDVCPDCWITDKDGKLYYLDCGDLFQWDAGDKLLRMTYESGTQVSNRCNTVAKVVHAGKIRDCSPHDTLFEYIGDDCILYQRHVNHSNCFNICRSRVEEYRVRVSGYRSIKRVELGPNRSCFQTVAA